MKRTAILRGLTVTFGLLAGLLFCEVVIRLFGLAPPPVDRFTIVDTTRFRTADCYPSAPASETSLPIDLRTTDGRDRFLLYFTESLRSMWRAGLPKNGVLDEFLEWVPSRVAAELLANVVPLCVLYDDGPESPRRIAAPSGATETIGLLGDSFIFGQGISDNETMTTLLAKRLRARIVSFAAVGADMPEIMGQFGKALAAQKQLGLKTLLYFYVLNDPLRDNALSDRLNHLNDLMNIRSAAIESSPSARWLPLARIWNSSALARLLVFQFSRRTVARETLDWYRALHDPKRNPRLEETFDILGAFTREARKRGIDFIVMVYPLMLDMAHYPLADAHDNIRRLAAEKKVELHDLLPAYEQAPRATLSVHPIDYHPNPLAQTIAADEAVRYLKSRPATSGR